MSNYYAERWGSHGRSAVFRRDTDKPTGYLYPAADAQKVAAALNAGTTTWAAETAPMERGRDMGHQYMQSEEPREEFNHLTIT